MIIVGVTGGIGSGKTVFCKELESYGAYVVYADDLAKKIMVSDLELIREIKSAFGAESYEEDGSLNRSYLAEEAFNKGRVQELNDLVHPVLWRETDRLLSEKEQEGVEVFVKEAAILLNNGRPENLDYVVLIEASLNKRVERVVKRDASNKDLVLDRVARQPDFGSLLHLVDFRIINDGSIEQLNNKAEELYVRIKNSESIGG